ncbi:DNA-nicking endonuclease, Smr domain [Marinospirillum celere]|uniref:DNA-nicking endonuclease, Smr domain n=1 Tax=Marinospirillum celere TaxID=1122252 RepID=A0A1I1K318_9GAMM|nr:Smr/MutS family protein [Marinospirillum celere]SFC52393.1 DNA-nicking endonuclease, Smr domain [Marinospirillum celere]
MSSSDDQPDDLNLFRELMKGVQPLRHDKKADLSKAPSRRDREQQALRRQAAETESVSQLEDGLSDGQVAPVNPGDSLAFHLPDLPQRTFQSLKKGRISWQEGLDLHGYTIEAARTQLTSFVRDGRARGYRCLLLIHGKAYNREGEVPSIKSHVNAWLKQMPEVLAFVSALPADGGTGAVYILLRTRQKS